MAWPADLGWWEKEGGQGQLRCMLSPHRTVCPRNWNVHLANTSVASFNSLSSDSSVSSITLKQPGEVGIVVMPTLQVRKLRVREAEKVAEPE